MIVFCVYHDLMTEARSQEIIKTCQSIDRTMVVSYSIPPFPASVILSGHRNGKRSYLSFFTKSIKVIKQHKPDIIVLHDNYCAPILFWLVHNKFKGKIIYDSSELYIREKSSTIKGKVIRIFEEIEYRYLKHSNIIIAANIERSMIMKGYYHLKQKPLVFDNIHRIIDEYHPLDCEKKYGHYFNKSIFSICYGGGISEDRGTYSLSRAVHKLGNKFQLLILGSCTQKELEKFQTFINRSKISNVFYLGYLPRSEFRYILKSSHANAVIFEESNLNNIFCASGKAFEGLFEDCVLLASENPPLKRLCEDQNLGVSTSDFYGGILEIKDHYNDYLENVKIYCRSINQATRIEKLSEEIKRNLYPI